MRWVELRATARRCPRAATYASCANDWILHRKDDELLAVPLHADAASFGEAIEVRCEGQLGFLVFLKSRKATRLIAIELLAAS